MYWIFSYCFIAFAKEMVLKTTPHCQIIVENCFDCIVDVYLIIQIIIIY